jgi:hypothetical protein
MNELPVCRWRREPTGPGRHMCVSPKLIVGGCGVPDGGCAACYCRDHEPPARSKGNCFHLGRITRRAECPPCTEAAGKPTTVPVHACALHRECSMTRLVPGLRTCATCGDHRPSWRRPDAGAIRHLTYHVYPRGEIWRWNIAHLRARLSLFNGRRLVAVAVDGESDKLADVRAALGDDMDIEYLHVANDRHLREMTTHPLLLERMADRVSPADCTWYGHAKGIGSSLVGDGVRRWAEEMYRGTLDYWPAVKRELRDHAAVGVFRRRTRHPPSVPVQWHYAGSFRWVRNADLYCRDWRVIDPAWVGPETYPGLHIPYEEAACLYGEWASGTTGLYSLAYWDTWPNAACEAFHATHRADRLQPVLATVILTAHRQPVRVHDAIASVLAQTSDCWQLLIVDSGSIASTGAYQRYAADSRVSVMLTGERPEDSAGRCAQGWAINESWRRGRVRGDLIFHLSDDDLLDPHAVEAAIARSRAQPNEHAWYGSAIRERIRADGSVKLLGELGTHGAGGPRNRLCGRVDGMQVIHRRGMRQQWPEEREARPLADGIWMDRIGEVTPIIPLPIVVGVHRHTPESTFTT